MTAGYIKTLSTAQLLFGVSFPLAWLSFSLMISKKSFPYKKSSAQESQPSEPDWFFLSCHRIWFLFLCVVPSLRMRDSWAFQMSKCGIRPHQTEPASLHQWKISLLPNTNGSMLSNAASPGVSPLVCETAQPRCLPRLWQPLSLFCEQRCRLVADSLEVGGSTSSYSEKRADFSVILFPLSKYYSHFYL